MPGHFNAAPGANGEDYVKEQMMNASMTRSWSTTIVAAALIGAVSMARANAPTSANPATAAGKKAPASATAPAGVPLRDLVVYPEKWAATAPAGTKLDSDQDNTARETLKKPMNIAFNGIGLEKMLNFVSNSTGMNMEVNWDALGKAGVARTTQVAMTLQNSPVREVLAAILANIDKKTNLACAAIDGVIVISTKQDLEDRLAHNRAAVPAANKPRAGQ